MMDNASGHSRKIALIAALLVLIIAGVYLYWPERPGRVPVVRGELPLPPDPSPVDAGIRQRIDSWLSEKHLNEFGDPPGTKYTGGTPLFDERTGLRKDRYEYILSKHPELKDAPKERDRK